MTIERQINQLLLDPDFQALKNDLDKPNIFDAVEITRAEIRHSAFLRWLLDPLADHGIGNQFLSRFVRRIDDQSNDDIPSIGTNIRVYKEWRNIDLLIVTSTRVICIENKIDTGEHSDQLDRYREIVALTYPDRHHTFLYLTIDGSDPEQDNLYRPVGYDLIEQTLAETLAWCQSNIPMYQRVVYYIEDYLSVLRRDILKIDHASELAKLLSEKHYELINQFEQHQENSVSAIFEALKSVFTDLDYDVLKSTSPSVWFIPKSLHDHLPSNKNRQCPSVWFSVTLKPKEQKIQFNAYHDPEDFPIEPYMDQLREFQSSVSKRLTISLKNKSTLFRSNVDFDFNNLEDIERRLTSAFDINKRPYETLTHIYLAPVEL